MVRIDWTDASKSDLSEIREYISKQSKKYAGIELKRIVASAGGLLEFPKSGKVVSNEYVPPMRQIISGNYKILYQYFPKSEEIWIIRVIHGALNTDFDNLVFEPEEEYKKEG